ncbi:hypothetical protein LUX33_51840 [Actinomadura madurae]|nr:hypothetical protein [Actinomadura madurae]MCP9955994.1 hypothetical protein [Actinomadura madurae]MCP9985252.1 hypothetical protein [Actinomadura madurae]
MAMRAAISPSSRVATARVSSRSQKSASPNFSSPTSPAPPDAPRRSRPSRTRAPPTPSSSHSIAKSSRPAAAPSRCSATAPRFTSFSMTTGAPSRSWSTAPRSGRQPGTPLSVARPVRGSIRPGVPRTTVCGTRPPAASATASATSAARSGAAGSGRDAAPAGAPAMSATPTCTASRRRFTPATWARSATSP